MGGTPYYSNEKCRISPDSTTKTEEFEFGRSGALGDGPQVYIRIGDKKVYIPRHSTSEFFSKVRALGDYLGR